MNEIQQAIIAVILDKFPGCDLMPSYDKETGLHLFQMICQKENSTFSIRMPEGFLITQLHVKNGKQIVWEMLIHEQIFMEVYRPFTHKTLEKCYA